MSTQANQTASFAALWVLLGKTRRRRSTKSLEGDCGPYGVPFITTPPPPHTNTLPRRRCHKPKCQWHAPSEGESRRCPAKVRQFRFRLLCHSLHSPYTVAKVQDLTQPNSYFIPTSFFVMHFPIPSPNTTFVFETSSRLAEGKTRL